MATWWDNLVLVVVLALISGCGSVTTAQVDGALAGEVGATFEASTDSTTDGASSLLDANGGGIDLTTGRIDAAPDTCVWDPAPHIAIPCDDGTHAVCCYTVQDGTCDGRKDGCNFQGFECVLDCSSLNKPNGKESAMTDKTDTLHVLNPLDIIPPDFNSRVSFDEDALKSLMAEIRKDGQRTPIEVQRVPGSNKYKANFGSRRLEACKRLDMPIKAIVVEPLEKKDAFFRNATENLQREDLTTFEIARVCAEARAMDVPIAETAERLNFSKGYVSQAVQLYTKLADPIKEAWERAAVIANERDPGKLTARQAAEIKATSTDFLYREVLKAGDEAKQVELWEGAVVELMKEREEGSTTKGNGKPKKKGGSTAAETMYRVTATRYGDVMLAIKKATDGGKVDAKLAANLVKYLVGDLDKVKGFVGEEKKGKDV